MSVLLVLCRFMWDAEALNRSTAPEQNECPLGPMQIHEGCGGPQQKYRPSTPLWSALRSDFINWTYEHSRSPEAGNSTLLMDYVCDKGMDEYRAMFASQDAIHYQLGLHAALLSCWPCLALLSTAYPCLYVQKACEQAALKLEQQREGIEVACLADLTAVGEGFHSVVWYTDHAEVCLEICHCSPAHVNYKNRRWRNYFTVFVHIGSEDIQRKGMTYAVL
eukprot:1161600-Pelagomonas_calceolata.AAC.5